MLSWNELTHAYGSAADVPAMLAAAESAPPPADYTDEPWYSLWSALCHQGDVYPASLAAVPELVAIAERRRANRPAIVECLHLAGSIEMERHQEGAPPIPAHLAPSYADALWKGAQLAEEALPRTDNPDHIKVLLLSLAAFRGDIAEARRIPHGEYDDE